MLRWRLSNFVDENLEFLQEDEVLRSADARHRVRTAMGPTTLAVMTPDGFPTLSRFGE